MRARPVALLGFMGAGKTAVGEAVAAQLGRRFLDLDRQVELALGRTARQIFEDSGEDAFRAAEARVLPSVLSPDTILALGGGAVMEDASWRLLKERALTVWLDASPEVLWRRVAAAPGRPLARSFEQFSALLMSRRRRYAEAERKVDAARPLEVVVQEVVALCAA